VQEALNSPFSCYAVICEVTYYNLMRMKGIFAMVMLITLVYGCNKSAGDNPAVSQYPSLNTFTIGDTSYKAVRWDYTIPNYEAGAGRYTDSPFVRFSFLEGTGVPATPGMYLVHSSYVTPRPFGRFFVADIKRQDGREYFTTGTDSVYLSLELDSGKMVIKCPPIRLCAGKDTILVSAYLKKPI